MGIERVIEHVDEQKVLQALEEYEELGWEEEEGPQIRTEIQFILHSDGQAYELGIEGLNLKDKLYDLWGGAKQKLRSSLSEDDVKQAKKVLLGYVVTNSTQLAGIFKGAVTPEEASEVLALVILWLLYQYRRDPSFRGRKDAGKKASTS